MPENAARFENKVITQPTAAEQNQSNGDFRIPKKILPPILTIDRIEPGGTVEEGAQIRVFFTVDNVAPVEWSGFVAYQGAATAPPGSSRVTITSLAAGTATTGMVAGRAPLAVGPTTPVQIDLLAPSTIEFVDNVVGSATMNIPISATYQFSIDSFTVDNPRAKSNDTVSVTCRFLVGDTPVPLCSAGPFDTTSADHTQDFGDHGAGDTVATNMCFRFGGVPGVAPDATVTFLIINGGFSGSKEESLRNLLDGISKGAQGAVTAWQPGAAGGWAIINDVTDWINAGFLPNCDGPVAADSLTLRSTTLASVMNSTGTFSEQRHYNGTSSPVFCGMTSNYDVRYTISRLSWFQQ